MRSRFGRRGAWRGAKDPVLAPKRLGLFSLLFFHSTWLETTRTTNLIKPPSSPSSTRNRFPRRHLPVQARPRIRIRLPPRSPSQARTHPRPQRLPSSPANASGLYFRPWQAPSEAFMGVAGDGGEGGVPIVPSFIPSVGAARGARALSTPFLNATVANIAEELSTFGWISTSIPLRTCQLTLNHLPVNPIHSNPTSRRRYMLWDRCL